MALTDSQWAEAAADIFARLAGGDITEAEAATELAAATADWPSRTLNRDLAEQLSRFKARVNGLILTDGPPPADLGGVNAVAIDLTERVFYGPKVVSTEWPDGEPFAEGPPGADGTDGLDGSDGQDAWTPVPALAADGARRVLQIADWTGGEGTKPTTGLYVGAAGLTNVLANAIDVRGAAGGDGTDGTNGTDGTDGTNGTDGSDGLNAWTPVPAVITDGARRVLQIVDWVGGEGTEPGGGLYVGATGLTAVLADAVDVRGAAGANGAGTGDLIAANNLSDLTDAGAARTNLSVLSSAQVAAAISAAIAALITGAPGALDTLNELAAALGDDPNFATTVMTAVGARLAKDQNLADLPSASTARTNLGLLALATMATVGTAQIDNDAVTFAKAQNIATARLVGRVTASSGDMEELTAAQVRTLLDIVFASKAAQAFVDLGDVSGTVTLDLDAGVNFKMRAVGNITLADPSNKWDGFVGIVKISQDGTGSRTIATNSAIKKTEALTLSTAASAVDQFTLWCEGTTPYISPLLEGFA